MYNMFESVQKAAKSMEKKYNKYFSVFILFI